VGAAGPDASVVDALAELATLAVATSDLRGALGRVAALAVRGIRRAQAASVLVGRPSAPELLVATDQRAQAGHGAQHWAEQGPVWDAYAAGTPTGTSRLEADDRWPRLAIAHPPPGGALAVPLPAAEAAGCPVGVLVLYGSAELATEPVAASRAAMFADGAAAVLREHQEVVELRTLERQLRDALESRAVIEQAKGILMARVGCDADEAFAMLSRASQARNVKLRLVAAQLVSEVASARPVG
jgi:ANTAR domain